VQVLQGSSAAWEGVAGPWAEEVPGYGWSRVDRSPVEVGPLIVSEGPLGSSIPLWSSQGLGLVMVPFQDSRKMRVSLVPQVDVPEAQMVLSLSVRKDGGPLQCSVLVVSGGRPAPLEGNGPVPPPPHALASSPVRVCSAEHRPAVTWCRCQTQVQHRAVGRRRMRTRVLNCSWVSQLRATGHCQPGMKSL
jgi:hypothetical protein